MRIGLAYDLQTHPQDARQAEFDPPATLDALCGALTELGHDPVRLGSAHELLAHPPAPGGVDLVLSIAEGVSARCREAWVPTLLDLWQVPYVGSDALALALGLDKAASKRLAKAAGLATPPWITLNAVRDLPEQIPLAFPVIVKPRYEGSGMGIDPGAVVSTMTALRARVAWLLEQMREWQRNGAVRSGELTTLLPEPVLIEEFISGGELTVLLVGNDPPRAYPAIQRAVDTASQLASHVSPKAPSLATPLALDAAVEQRARDAALAVFDALGCSDMARVDLRVDAEGAVWFLEINPLPSFDPQGTVGWMAECEGRTYAQLVGDILAAAAQRLARA